MIWLGCFDSSDDLLVHCRPTREVFDKSEVVYLTPCADCNGKYQWSYSLIVLRRNVTNESIQWYSIKVGIEGRLHLG
jgi:hypothetical protein